jgi:hypothetical protein
LLAAHLPRIAAPSTAFVGHQECLRSIEAACWAVRSELALRPVFLRQFGVVALTAITPHL